LNRLPTFYRTASTWGKPATTASLPGAEQEAQVIAPLLNTKHLIGKDATKAAIVRQLPSSRIIHMATHGMALSE
jgi:CHAT domain-containing protein